MRINNIFKSNQEQAIAAWIQHLNNIRIEEMITQLAKQEMNFQSSMSQLILLKFFVDSPEHILGSTLTKHGEIAEHVQVRFSNADRMLLGKQGNHTFSGVGRTAMEDYLRNGKMIQFKFYNGEKGTFHAVVKHLNTYPKFIKQGGSYDIPKNQYNKLMDIYHRGETARATLNRSEETLFKQMKNWEVKEKVKVSEVIHPSKVDYKEVQLNNVNKVINNKGNEIKRKNKTIKNKIVDQHKPTLQEGVQTTVLAASLEGGTTFCMKVYEEIKKGKKISEFTSNDWKNIGIDTAHGTVKGAIRGGSIYTMTNFLKTSAPVANSLVTASFGVVSLARKLENNDITNEEFLISSEVICMDVSLSTLSATLGQTLIPVPVLGAIIGNTVGMFMVEIGKNYLNIDEQKLINNYVKKMNYINRKYEKEYNDILEKIQIQEQKFNSLVDLAFDKDVNKAFEASIQLARNEGVNSTDVLKDLNDIDVFFL